MKVAHILYQSLPQVSGSSIRSRDLLMAQKELGLDVVAITSVFQSGSSETQEDIINDIRYIRTTTKKETTISDDKKSIVSQFRKFFSIIPFTLKLYKLVSKEKPDILHAHAMFFCAIPAIIIGRLKKVPVVYEFRSLWMFQHKSKQKTRLERIFENFMVSVEVFALKRAKHVVFLNEDLKQYFKKHQRLHSKSTVINNAVNVSYIEAQQQKVLETKSKDEMVFGYIGTLTAYEGIPFLVEAFQELYDEGVPVRLLIFGDGISKSEVLKKINAKKRINTIKYEGSLLPEDVSKAYAKIDVIVNPRLSNSITESVTPLKPLEAFAYNKLFLGSNVGGILALVEPEKTGFIFEAGNKQDLKAQIKRVINYPQEQKVKIVENANAFVKKEKSWKSNAEKYLNIYKALK